MVKKIVRAGIVGSGFAAKFHYEALQYFFNAEVLISGAYSLSPQNLLAFTQPRQLTAFNNLDDLINESTVIAALKSNKHVIVEKTFTGYFGDGSEDFNGNPLKNNSRLASDVIATIYAGYLPAEKKGKEITITIL
ncbi:MAG: hypothetical protein Q8891_09195 [Bacteroidota bacterium]|nr:hypothetical protein [Bacteroidota bacterium]